MELKTRLVYIMNRLNRVEDGKAVKELLDDLNITQRTFYYDMEQINSWLSMNDLGKMLVSNQKIHFIVKDQAVFQRMLSKTQSYYFSVSDRRAMEIIYIALYHDTVTIDRLRDVFYVSKNTILSDIKSWKQFLKDWHITISSTVKTGYVFKGAETAIRKLISKQMTFLLSNLCVRTGIKEILSESLFKLTQNDIDFFEISSCIIKQYAKDIKGELFLTDIDLECMLVLVSWIRSMKGYTVEVNADEKAALFNTASYCSLKLSLQKLVLHNMHIPATEIYYLIPLFLGIRTTDFVSEEQENTYIMEFTKELVRNFECVACISFISKDILYHQLSFHIRPLYYRLKYGIISPNPLVGDIQKTYAYIYDFTARALAKANNELSNMINEDELAYLCIYFANHLNHKKVVSSSPERKGKILIVVGTNMAQAMLLQEQLTGLFYDHFDYEKISIGRLKSWMLNDYVLVVTTIAFENFTAYSNVICVEPFINDVRKRKIIDVIEAKGGAPRYNERIRKVIDAAKSHCSGEVAENDLYFDLFRIFYNEEKRSSFMSDTENIREKLEKGKVLRASCRKNWKDILEMSCKQLRGTYYTKRTFERLSNLLQRRKGKIYQVYPEVLCICCPMQGESYRKIGIAVVVSEEAIEFPAGQKGRIVLFIATIDNYSHWPLLIDTYKYLENKEHVAGMLESFGSSHSGNL